MNVYIWFLVAISHTAGGYNVVTNVATTPTLKECQRVSVVMQQFYDTDLTKMKCVQVLKP